MPTNFVSHEFGLPANPSMLTGHMMRSIGIVGARIINYLADRDPEVTFIGYFNADTKPVSSNLAASRTTGSSLWRVHLCLPPYQKMRSNQYPYMHVAEFLADTNFVVNPNTDMSVRRDIFTNNDGLEPSGDLKIGIGVAHVIKDIISQLETLPTSFNEQPGNWTIR